jgi:hypothetical protein
MPLFKKTAREGEKKECTLQLRDTSAFVEILITPEKEF